MINYDGHFFGGGFMWILWIVIAAGIFLLIQNMMKGNSDNSSSGKETPLEILKKRYARGEIEEEEYERRRKELEG